MRHVLRSCLAVGLNYQRGSWAINSIYSSIFATFTETASSFCSKHLCAFIGTANINYVAALPCHLNNSEAVNVWKLSQNHKTLSKFQFTFQTNSRLSFSLSRPTRDIDSYVIYDPAKVLIQPMTFMNGAFKHLQPAWQLINFISQRKMFF